ncbi:MAG: class I SAM-dependent methyltransferase [Deferrisomatales bacterium]|nr:class I SAM-dependent methyltransferase [Deferrisomatales bacterium]
MDQDYSKRFYAALAPAYDWVFGPALERGRRDAVRLVRPGERVLEMGVGTGLGLRHYPSGCHVVGVDICRQMLRKARWRALVEGNGRRIELRCADATRLDYPDGAFDAVVAPYVVTTVGEPDLLCREMRRLCRVGGRVIVVSNTREGGYYGAVKSRLSPLMERVGFRTDLDVEGVLRGAGLRLLEARRVPPLSIHKVFVAEPA